jgi:outer membrane protein
VIARRMVSAALAVAVMLAAGVARAESLADALADAYRNSNLLEQNRAVLRAADEDVAQAVATLRPVISFVAGATYSDPAQAENLNASLSLSAEITLYDFGRNRLALDAAQESVLATRQALVNIEQVVLINAVGAYVGVVSGAETVRLREANLRLISQELQAAQDRFEVGEVTRTDVSIAEARLAASRASLAAAQGDLQIAIEDFRESVGRAPGALTGPGRVPSLPATEDEARSVAVRTHPSILQAQHTVAVNEISAERARLLTRGALTGSANVGLDDDGVDQYGLSLSFRQPIYQGGAISSTYRQSLARRDASRAELLESIRGIEAGVGRAWARILVAQATLEASDRQIRAAQVAFEGVQEEARLGARTTLDVLNAEQELLDARTARVDAEAQQVVAVYGLLQAMGLLTVSHLGLGVPVYDPTDYYNAVRNAPVTSVQGQRLDRILERFGQD